MKNTADNKLSKYIDKLYRRRKKTLFASLKRRKTESRKLKIFDIEQYNRELDEAEAAIERGEFSTHEEVMASVKELLQQKRNPTA